MKNTICFLSSVHKADDVRVFYKEAISLSRAGYNVIVLSPENHGIKSSTQSDIKIITYKSRKGIIGRILQLPKLFFMGAKLKAHYYHCNEVDSWLVGVLLKIFLRKKIIFDVHEHYPETFAKSRFPSYLTPFIAFIIKFIFFILIPFTDQIVLAKKSIKKDFPASKNKQILVENFALISYSDLKQNSSENGIRVIHHGVIGRKRGWPELLKAFSLIKSSNIHLHIIGTFRDGSQNDFFKEVQHLNLQDKLTFEEWMPFEKVFKKVLSSHIGIILFQPGIYNHIHALPHKMFDYMLAELPVIIPYFSIEIAEIVKKSNCGLLIDPTNPDEIAEAILYLANNPEKKKLFGRNGKNAVLKYYNWENEAKKLVAMYDGLNKYN